MVDNSERPSINISAIPVAGIGGLGMVGLVVIMAMAFPVARSLLAGGLAGGVLLALTLLFARRHRRLGAPRGDQTNQHLLGRYAPHRGGIPTRRGGEDDRAARAPFGDVLTSVIAA